MIQQFESIGIKTLTTCIPSQVVTNDQIAKDIWSEKEQKMFEKTVGIKERRWSSKDVKSSDLGLSASRSALENIDLKDIKIVIFLSQTPDFKIPFTSNILQSKLGLSNDVNCIDVNAGCNGFIQGLSMAFSMALTLEENDLVLLVVAETLSRLLNSGDKTTYPLFGDAAAAMVVGKNSQFGKSYFNFFSNGDEHQAIIVKNMNNSKEGLIREFLTMQGEKVFDFTMSEVAKGINKLLQQTNTLISDFSKVALHQSNRLIIKQITSELGVPKDRVLINIEKFGNTSGVSIPLALSDLINEGKEGELVLCSGYGSGLSWGNCILSLKNTLIKKPTFL